MSQEQLRLPVSMDASDLHASDTDMLVATLDKKHAAQLVVARHYLHRRPPISFAYGVYRYGQAHGVVTFGIPASRHLQKSLCPDEPGHVIELNRLWLDDALPRNTASWFLSRALRMLPPRIVVSYADPVWGHVGYVYRALNFNYAGWTDMDRKTPRYDYIPHDPRQHTREAFRSGYAYKRRRVAKVKYWKVTGNRSERKALTAMAAWPVYSWKEMPPPIPDANEDAEGGAA